MTVRSIYMSTRLVPLRNKESGVMFALMGDRASRGSEGGITGDGVTRKDVVYPKRGGTTHVGSLAARGSSGSEGSGASFIPSELESRRVSGVSRVASLRCK